MSNPTTTRYGRAPIVPLELANKAYVDAQISGGLDLTTKGDLHGFDSVDKRIAVGTNDQVLTADSTDDLGVAWKAAAGGGLWTVLGDYEAASAEASHEFTFSSIDFDDISKLVLVIDGGSTAALALQLRINTIVTNTYYTDGRLIEGGTETIIDLNTQVAAQIISANLLDAAREFVGTIDIYSSKTIGRCSMHSMMGSPTKLGNEVVSNILTDIISALTAVEVRTSTSTWKIGTRFTLYSVARA